MPTIRNVDEATLAEWERKGLCKPGTSRLPRLVIDAPTYAPKPLPAPRGPHGSGGRLDEPRGGWADGGDEPYVCVTISQLRTRNPTNNLRHHWVLKRERDEQKKAVATALSGVLRSTWDALAKGCVVTLTRYSAGTLDASDNLRSALKHVKDQIALEMFGGAIGRNDDRKTVRWEYRQMRAKRGEYGVIISIHIAR